MSGEMAPTDVLQAPRRSRPARWLTNRRGCASISALKGFRHAALVGALSLAGCASSSVASETSPGADDPRPAPDTSERDAAPSWMSVDPDEGHSLDCMACENMLTVRGPEDLRRAQCICEECEQYRDEAAVCAGCMVYEERCSGGSYGQEYVEGGLAAPWKKRAASLLVEILRLTPMSRGEYLRHERSRTDQSDARKLSEYRWRVLQKLKKQGRK